LGVIKQGLREKKKWATSKPAVKPIRKPNDQSIEKPTLPLWMLWMYPRVDTSLDVGGESIIARAMEPRVSADRRGCRI
jgi:hypothetical protein